jgi:hypothetical protein
MKREPRFTWRHLGIAVAVVAGLGAPAPALVAAPAQPCCFANERYEGLCRVIPAEGETCQSILAYLSNPMSTGKSYCGGSSVRGGWVLVDCKTGKPVPQKPADSTLGNTEKRARGRTGTN